MSSGGKRSGAGRPTKGDLPRKAVTVSIELPLLKALRQQAEVLNVSLADVFNLRLKESMQKQPKPDETTNSAYTELIRLSDEFEQKLNAPLDEDLNELPPVPTYQELEAGIQEMRRTRIEVNRSKAEIQYWRKRYRQDRSFKSAMNQLGRHTHAEFPNVIMDNVTPVKLHREALALACLEPDQQKLVAFRLLNREKDLKKAVAGFVESFREAAKAIDRQEGSLIPAYYFSSEMD